MERDRQDPMRQSGRSGSEMGRRGSQLWNRLQVGKQFSFKGDSLKAQRLYRYLVVARVTKIIFCNPMLIVKENSLYMKINIHKS